MSSKRNKDDTHALSTVLTIGHSTRTIEEFIRLLQAHSVACVVDVRTVPRSRHNPQFNRDIVPASLNAAHIGYEHMAGLGGLRHAQRDSVNMGWRNVSFRGYADYMQTPEFEGSLQALIKLAKHERIALMCAEAVPWRCHRSMIADALVVRGIQTEDILGINRRALHSLTSLAKVKDRHITTPPEDSASGKLRLKKGSSVKTAARCSADRRHSTMPSVALDFPSWLRSWRITAPSARDKADGGTTSSVTVGRRESDDKVSAPENSAKEDRRKK